MSKYDEIQEKIIKYYKEHDDEFTNVIENLDANYSEILREDDRYYEMADLDKIDGIYSRDTLENLWVEMDDFDNDDLEKIYMEEGNSGILELVLNGDCEVDLSDIFSGRDEETGGPFNPDRYYFYHSNCNWLVSTNHKAYSDYLGENFVHELSVYRDYLYLSDEVIELLKQLDEAEDEED